MPILQDFFSFALHDVVIIHHSNLPESLNFMFPDTEMYFLYIIHLIKGYILYVEVLFKAQNM